MNPSHLFCNIHNLIHYIADANVCNFKTSQMSRFAGSPLIDDRSPKRTKMAPDQAPDCTAEIVPDGDVMLVVNGLSSSPDKP